MWGNEGNWTLSVSDRTSLPRKFTAEKIGSKTRAAPSSWRSQRIHAKRKAVYSIIAVVIWLTFSSTISLIANKYHSSSSRSNLPTFISVVPHQSAFESGRVALILDSPASPLKICMIKNQRELMSWFLVPILYQQPSWKYAPCNIPERWIPVGKLNFFFSFFLFINLILILIIFTYSFNIINSLKRAPKLKYV